MTLAELIEAERLDFDREVDPKCDRLCECSPTPGVRASRLLRADRGQRCPDCGGPGEVIDNPWVAAEAELAALIAERDRLRTELAAERERRIDIVVTVLRHLRDMGVTTADMVACCESVEGSGFDARVLAGKDGGA